MKHCLVSEILSKLELTEDQFSGIASKFEIHNFNLERKFTSYEFLSLTDFLRSRLRSVNGKSFSLENTKIKVEKKQNLWKKTVKKISLTCQDSNNTISTVYDKAIERNGLGRAC